MSAQLKERNGSPEGETRVRLSVRTKLVGLVTLLVIAALGGMIVVATAYFREDIEVRVQEQNLNLVRLLGTRVRAQFRRIFTEMRAQAGQTNAASLGGWAFLGELDGNPPRVRRLQHQARFFEDNSIDLDKVVDTLEKNAAQLAAATESAPVFLNLSPGFPAPILAVATATSAPTSKVIVAVLEPSALAENFALAGSVQAVLASLEGTVLADTDGRRVFAGASLKGLAVHERMRQSQLDNGQLRVEGAGGVPALASFLRLPEYGLAIVAQVPESVAFAAVERMQRRNLFIIFIFLGTTILGVWLLARRLTTPLVKLAEATRQIEQGHYDISLRARARDEVGVLTTAFNRMALGLQEREKVKEVLGKFIDHEIAERVLSGGIKPGGERRRCAILFCDLRGFTQMSHNRPPEEVVEILNEYFTEMVNWVLLTRGVVDKFIGDAIMAHWGVLDDSGNIAERAVNAAVLMRKSLLELNARNRGRRPPLRFGIGINVGPVIAGQLGSDRRLEYTVIGETVNLASRIEAMNKTFRTDILITEETQREVQQTFHCALLPPVRVKGDPRPLRVYAVLGRKDDAACPRSVSELTALISPDMVPTQAPAGAALLDEELELVMK